MVSGHRGFEGILESMDAGADDYLVKPLVTHDLEARLIAAAGSGRAEGNSRTSAPIINISNRLGPQPGVPTSKTKLMVTKQVR